MANASAGVSMQHRVLGFERPALAVLAAALLAVYGCSFTILAPLLSGIAHALGVGVEARGLLISAEFGGNLAAIAGAGFVADRYGRRGVLIAGAASLAVGAAALAFSHSLWPAAAGLVLLGVGSGSVNVSASSLFADLAPARSGFALTLSRIFPSIGTLVGPLSLGFIQATPDGWRGAFGGIALLTAVFCALLALSRFPSQSGGRGIGLRDAAQLLRQGRMLVLIAATGLYVGAEVGFWGWMGTLLDEAGRTASSGPALLVFFAGLLVGRIAMPWLSLRVRAEHVVVGAALAGCAALAGIAWALGSVAFWPWTALVGCCMGPILPGLLEMAARAAERTRGTAIGAIMTGADLGGIFIPPAVGLVAAQTTLSSGIGWVAGAAMAGVLLAIAAITRAGRASKPESLGR